MDDTFLFHAGKEDSIFVAKAILLAYECASELRKNFHKSFIYLFECGHVQGKLGYLMDDLQERFLSFCLSQPTSQ